MVLSFLKLEGLSTHLLKEIEWSELLLSMSLFAFHGKCKQLHNCV